MKRKRKPYVWLTRECPIDSGDTYKLFFHKPQLHGYQEFFSRSGSCLGRFCAGDFEHITGLKLKAGQCVRVRISVRKVKS